MPILFAKSRIMKNTFTPLITVFALVLFLSSCKKDKDTPQTPAPKTKTELISTGTWKFSKAMWGSIDVSGSINACQKDNILSFQANGNGTIDEGLSKCNGTDPQTNPFTWNFASSEAVLHVSAVFYTGGNNDFNIVELTETKLVGSQLISGQTVVVTFVH
jgi:hypothetical protein